MPNMRGKDWTGITGADHPQWKGGRHIAWNGYVRVLRRNHPRALSNGYVWEHILVMEEKLGRPMKYFGKGNKNNETVHHINSNKTDNRPENLMLLSPSDHAKEEWATTPLKYPQSKESQAQTPARYAEWREKNSWGSK